MNDKERFDVIRKEQGKFIWTLLYAGTLFFGLIYLALHIAGVL